ncbi:MAG: dihydroorotate dehydrogenase electron transfer subunit [Kiritimatiellae bacterium]|jgi:dihydroorotate dehydrogenase electron transfer subunit|nr:dihydroorotate dehydrogenase electron transfer subunit [Kiritimatiellia bacterium]
MFDFLCKVKEHPHVTDDYMLIQLHAGKLAEQARPGQFVHIRIPGLEKTSLRRPFSIYNSEDGILSILYKAVGRGTEVMQSLQPDSELQVIGPLGNGFPLDGSGEPLLVAGGYGVAPLYFLATRLNRKGVLLVGGRTAEDILAIDKFKELGWRVVVATNDGSMGEKGFVTVPLLRELESCKAAGKEVEMFSCGPDAMLKAVGEMAIKSNSKAWLSLDKHMVCGVGACLACVQKLHKPDGSTWIGRVCSDGPIFEAGEIVW